MEKITKLLAKDGKTYQVFLWRIVGAVRRKAETIPTFRDSHNGCIRITIVPLCREAEVWLGDGLSDYADGQSDADVIDFCEREFVFKIDPRGSHTIQWTDPEDGHVEPVNCYGYSALKTAWASLRRNFEKPGYEGGLSKVLAEFSYREHPEFFATENGWSTHDGAVCATVTCDDKDFIRLYVCTSGAKSSEDKECSLAGMLAAQECLVCYEVWANRIKFNPFIDGSKTPLAQAWRDK